MHVNRIAVDPNLGNDLHIRGILSQLGEDIREEIEEKL